MMGQAVGGQKRKEPLKDAGQGQKKSSPGEILAGIKPRAAIFKTASRLPCLPVFLPASLL
jgi:hypothetical protein